MRCHIIGDIGLTSSGDTSRPKTYILHGVLSYRKIVLDNNEATNELPLSLL